MATIRNSHIYLSLNVVLLAGLLSSCGSGGSSSSGGNALGASPSSSAVSAVIGTTGGSLTSSDGTATLTVPPGALAADTKITMTEVSGSDIPAELQAPSVLKVYDMQPDGLQFAMPATMEVHAMGSAAPPDGAPLIGFISDSEGTLEVLGPLSNSVDDAGITASAPISHFSSVATVKTNDGVTVSAAVSPTSLPVHNDFKVTLEVKKAAKSGAGWTAKTGVTEGDESGFIIRLQGQFDPQSYTLEPGQEQDIIRTVSGTCFNMVGTAHVLVNAFYTEPNTGFLVTNFSGEAPNVVNNEIDVTRDMILTVDCTALPSVPPTTGLGLHANPGGLTKSEQAVFLGSAFANLTGGALAAFSGAEGYVITDLVTGEVKRTKTGSAAPLLGAVPISQDPPGPDSHAAVFAYGSNSYIDDYFPLAGDFGGFVFTFRNGITDVSNAGGALTTDEQLYVDDFGLHFVVYSPATNDYEPIGGDIAASGIGNGAQVSAFELTAGGPVLVVTRNLSGNGSLYFVPRDGTTPTYIGEVDPDARRIRCKVFVCAVTSFASDELTIVLWDGINPPTIIGNVPVGDGPVDLDLVALTNGNVTIGSTGFNDNTWTLTEIASDGSTVSNTTQPVDDGCINPGHLSFFEDGDGKKAFIPCYSSDNYAVQAWAETMP